MSKADFLKDNLREGEQYAGIQLGVNVEPDHHIFLMPHKFTGTWAKAVAHAKDIAGSLPTRREMRILFANAKQYFEGDWHWTDEQHAVISDYAWVQVFGVGFQFSGIKSDSRLARFVRRLVIL